MRTLVLIALCGDSVLLERTSDGLGLPTAPNGYAILSEAVSGLLKRLAIPEDGLGLRRLCETSLVVDGAPQRAPDGELESRLYACVSLPKGYRPGDPSELLLGAPRLVLAGDATSDPSAPLDYGAVIVARTRLTGLSEEACGALVESLADAYPPPPKRARTLTCKGMVRAVECRASEVIEVTCAFLRGRGESNVVKLALPRELRAQWLVESDVTLTVTVSET